VAFFKRRRTEAELRDIAKALRKGWTPGDPIASHLRRALPAINQMVHDQGVLIADIGRALDLAGIHYSTGH